MATDHGANEPGASLSSAASVGNTADSSSASFTSNTAATVVLDKLASLDVARKARRERRREESKASADPRESVGCFLAAFASRHRNIEEALQRMLSQQPGASTSQRCPPREQRQELTSAPGDTGAVGAGASPSPSAEASAAAAPLAPLSVSAANPEQVHASLELISAEVLSLEQFAAAASYYLPPYDQKQCAVTVAALRAAIEGARTSLVPRRRFAFGSGKIKISKVRGEEVSAAAAATTTPATSQAAACGSTSAAACPSAAAVSTLDSHASATTSIPDHPPSARTLSLATTFAAAASSTPLHAVAANDDDLPATLTISEHDRALVARGRGLMGLTDATVVLRAEEVSEGGAGGDFVLLGLTRCRIVLLGRLRALRVAGLRSCTLVAGPVTGACFVDIVRGSSLALATYQVRVHRTLSTDVFLRVRSKPIIEHSTGIRVAPWTAAVVPEHRLEALLQAHMLGQETGCWQQVDDFGWIKAVQSPNWGIMPPEAYPSEPMAVPERVWESEPAAVGAGATSEGHERPAAQQQQDGGDLEEI